MSKRIDPRLIETLHNLEDATPWQWVQFNLVLFRVWNQGKRPAGARLRSAWQLVIEPGWRWGAPWAVAMAGLGLYCTIGGTVDYSGPLVWLIGWCAVGGALVARWRT